MARKQASKTQPADKPGGRSLKDVDADRLVQLNAGTIEVRNLMEGLSIDLALLLKNALPEIQDEALETLRAAAGEGITRRMALASRLILEQFGPDSAERLAGHPSDTVRGWACYLIGQTESLSLKDRLQRIRPLADDSHFGVREWVWMAVRPHLAAELPTAIRLLTPWAKDSSVWIRRFSCESIRPRGVWCSHIDALKREPELALPILEPLKADPEKYVQDSVANWLNDASKTSPDWVRALCQRWQSESPKPTTQRICKRALRTIGE